MGNVPIRHKHRSDQAAPTHTLLLISFGYGHSLSRRFFVLPSISF